MKESILIIEDDRRIADWLRLYLEKAEYSTSTAYDGTSGLSAAREMSPDLVILDLNLPGIDGMEICKILRKESQVPIIMLTARESHADRVKGLSQGADDYVVKPFDPDELVARVSAVLRRVNKSVQQQLVCNNIVMDVENNIVTVNQIPVDLSHIQFVILEVFLRHPNQLLSREQLISLVYKDEFEGYDRAVDNHILRLRKKIGTLETLPIKSVYGAGYKLVPGEM